MITINFHTMHGIAWNNDAAATPVSHAYHVYLICDLKIHQSNLSNIIIYCVCTTMHCVTVSIYGFMWAQRGTSIPCFVVNYAGFPECWLNRHSIYYSRTAEIWCGRRPGWRLLMAGTAARRTERCAETVGQNRQFQYRVFQRKTNQCRTFYFYKKWTNSIYVSVCGYTTISGFNVFFIYGSACFMFVITMLVYTGTSAVPTCMCCFSIITFTELSICCHHHLCVHLYHLLMSVVV